MSRLAFWTSLRSEYIPRNAEVPRALVRDMYTKSWSAFDRLVAVVPPGGSIGSVLVTERSTEALTDFG